jgi:hypothetical protein
MYYFRAVNNRCFSLRPRENKIRSEVKRSGKIVEIMEFQASHFLPSPCSIQARLAYVNQRKSWLFLTTHVATEWQEEGGGREGKEGRGEAKRKISRKTWKG